MPWFLKYKIGISILAIPISFDAHLLVATTEQGLLYVNLDSKAV
jgi:hypothetical protein